MRTICFLLLYCFSTIIHGQAYLTNFSQFVQGFCPYNPNVVQTTPEGWTIYQTTDGFWDGTVDSTRCISVEPVQWNGMSIALDQINPAEPVFIRMEISELSNIAPLKPNWIYNLFSCMDMGADTISWKTGTTCEEGICSGVMIGIAIPDSFGTPYAATRFQTGFANSEANGFCGGQGIETCFPSEYFQDQYIREIILKFSFEANADLPNKQLHIRNLILENGLIWGEPGYVSSVEAQPGHFSNGEYTVNVAEVATPTFLENYLMLYTAGTYPDNDHQSYVEAAPAINSSVQQTINLEINEYQNLEIQPFTNLRGALVEGSDSLRHIANLVNMGGDFCTNFIDLIISGGGEYRHGGGHITMHNPRSCMQFRTGSALRVLNGKTLYYGNEGAGMLVLCPSSTIALERNATLVMNGLLNLTYCKEDKEDQQVYVDLPPGAKLIFGEHARISNEYSLNQQTKLQVRMLGGTLDDSALAAQDRAKIQRVYPEPSPSFLNNVGFYPNPFSDYFTLTYLSATEEVLQLNWTNINGQIVLEERFNAQKGRNEWQPDLPVAAGIYLLSITGKSGSTTQKIIRTTP